MTSAAVGTSSRRQPGRRVPQVRADERLRAVRVDLVGAHDDRGARRLAHGAGGLEHLGRRRDAGAAVDAQRLVATGDQEEQADVAGRDDVGQRVEAAVAGRVGDREVVLVEDRDEARRATTGRRVGATIGVLAGDDHQRRGGDQARRRLVEHPNVLGPRALGRRLVQLGKLVSGAQRGGERVHVVQETTCSGASSTP